METPFQEDWIWEGKAKARETFKQFQLHIRRLYIAQALEPIILQGLSIALRPLHLHWIVSQALWHLPLLSLPLSIAVTLNHTTTLRHTFVQLPLGTPWIQQMLPSIQQMLLLIQFWTMVLSKQPPTCLEQLLAVSLEALFSSSSWSASAAIAAARRLQMLLSQLPMLFPPRLTSLSNQWCSLWCSQWCNLSLWWCNLSLWWCNLSLWWWDNQHP